LAWLQQLQTQQLDIRQYEYSSLAKVQQWSEIEPGQQLFESIVVFENYPLDDARRALTEHREYSLPRAEQLSAGASGLTRRVLAAPHDLRSGPLRCRHDRSNARAPANLLAAMAADPDQKLADLPVIGSEEYHQIVVEWNQTETSPGASRMGARAGRGSGSSDAREDSGRCQ
jgi:surfactin family lipopeptide synthetase C